MTRVWLSFLVLSVLLMTLVSCEKETERPAVLTFIEPSDLWNSTWKRSDPMVIVLSAEIPDGRMRPVGIGLGRYHTNNQQTEKQPAEMIVEDVFESSDTEEVFTVRWELPDNLGLTSEDNHYAIIVTRNAESQPVSRGGQLRYPIIIEK